MTAYGYARVSTNGQDLGSQEAELMAAGCAKVFKEKVSGAKTDRTELAKVIRRLEPGDVLVVTRLDSSSCKQSQQSSRLLYDLVGAGKHGCGDVDAGCLGGFEIDDQLEPRGLLHGQIRRLRAFEDLVYVGGCPSVHVSEVRPICDQATSLCVVSQAEHGWQPVVVRKYGDLRTVTKGQVVFHDDERSGAVLGCRPKCRLEVAWAT